MKKYMFIVEKTGTGFSAYAKDDSINVGTTGNTMTELKANIVEAFNLLNEHLNRKPISESNISIQVDLNQFFEYYSDLIKAQGVAKRIGMNQSLLAQYINGSKQASEKQTERIIKGVKDVAKEILELELA
ncbi:XRE family transcriptional regulator [Pararcticibacter amylolyticus]|uniref:XRE family transcriptional regulator n=1 Tax=Pararcticibacter amylolyticus TaxID=2173175 RepID=A0A2U2PDP8_9SPHI|nr:XRE family transcriptional regulator [Pararcticibacter amylolyticus]PWG79531.1 XRE family transcriptional regulator [Pararcticibacter amylolyticus]